MMDEVKAFLSSVNIPFEGNALLRELQSLGVGAKVDLVHVELEDLSETGLSTIQKRKLIKEIKKLESAVTTQPTPPGHQQHTWSGIEPPEVVQSSNRGPDKHKIYYIFCKELFSRTIPREVITNLDFEHDSFELIIKMLSGRHKYPLDDYAFEFYSQEGYPLGVNKFSAKFPLCRWKIENESLLYVFVRQRKQPWAECTASGFTNDGRKVDPKSGCHRVKVYSHLFETFIINADLGKDDVLTLKKKVSLYTGLPVMCIYLYEDVSGHRKLKDDQTLQDWDNNSCLVLRIKEFIPAYTSLSKKIYNPTQVQTDRGIAKFYSILLYLVRSENVIHRKFVFNIWKLSSCPPLAYAFDQLIQDKSIQSLSHIVALFEGCYQLFQAVLGYFCNDVQPEKCFEFCDYIFGYLLRISKKTNDPSSAQTENVNLQCPITGRQFLNPVTVPTGSIYERFAVEEKIKGGLGLPECTCATLELGDIRPAEKECLKLLMYRAFFDTASNSCSSCWVWKSPPKPQKEIPTIMISCTWRDLNEAINDLNIQPPDDLSSRKYCLTVVDKGQFVFYTEPLKAAEKQVNVTDCIKGEDKVFTSSQMEGFATDWKSKAFHKLTDYLNPKIKASVSAEDLESSISTVVQGAACITKEPEEAIMVLFDCSASMSEKIFDKTSSSSSSSSSSTQYSKLTAAKELFYAFANRTEAYGFNHVIGLITVNSTATISIEFTHVMEDFKNVVGELKAGGRTALNKAMQVAADSLESFTKEYPNCQKRILCLTDGEDNESKISAWDITTRLQKEKIVVDTILITESGNLQQKAISHATAGFCFKPSDSREATRLFEMEVLLRFKDRSTNSNRPTVSSKSTFQKFQSISDYPYDSTNPYDFKTTFVEESDQLLSYSAKKMVNLASLMGHSSTATTSSSAESVRRVVLEVRNYLRDPHPAVDIFPGQDNVLHWKILLKGPDECPYAGGNFLLLAKFPEDYPSKPPEIRFVTPIYHCNINSSGRICHPILGRNYVPSMTIRFIIDNIYGLLMAPEPFDPLDSVLASQYHDSRAEYEAQATQLTEKYAKRIGWDELKKELTDEDLDVAEGLVCPLTNQLFVDPVMTPHGFTYERKALLDVMKRNGNKDPKAHKPLQISQLVPQRNIKQLADQVRKSSIRK